MKARISLIIAAVLLIALDRPLTETLFAVATRDKPTWLLEDAATSASRAGNPGDDLIPAALAEGNYFGTAYTGCEVPAAGMCAMTPDVGGTVLLALVRGPDGRVHLFALREIFP